MSDALARYGGSEEPVRCGVLAGVRMATLGFESYGTHLSRYLERVQAGEEVVVTDRGTGGLSGLAHER